MCREERGELQAFLARCRRESSRRIEEHLGRDNLRLNFSVEPFWRARLPALPRHAPRDVSFIMAVLSTEPRYFEDLPQRLQAQTTIQQTAVLAALVQLHLLSAPETHAVLAHLLIDFDAVGHPLLQRFPELAKQTLKWLLFDSDHEALHCLLAYDGRLLRVLSERFAKDRSLVRVASLCLAVESPEGRRRLSGFISASEVLRRSQSFVRCLLSCGCDIYPSLPPELQAQPAIFKLALQKTIQPALVVNAAPTSILRDQETLLLALDRPLMARLTLPADFMSHVSRTDLLRLFSTAGPETIRNVSRVVLAQESKLVDDATLQLAILDLCPPMLASLPLCNDDVFLTQALKLRPEAYASLPADLKNRKDLAAMVVQRVPELLETVPLHLRRSLQGSKGRARSRSPRRKLELVLRCCVCLEIGGSQTKQRTYVDDFRNTQNAPQGRHSHAEDMHSCPHGHLVCHSCLARLTGEAPSCPICKQRWARHEFTPSRLHRQVCAALEL